MVLALYTLRPVTLSDRVVPAGTMLHVTSLAFALRLIASGRAEPNNRATAEACELALRLRVEAELLA
jgi:hypothetical protein